MKGDTNSNDSHNYHNENHDGREFNEAWHLYPYYDIENTELYKWNVHLKPDRKQ